MGFIWRLLIVGLVLVGHFAFFIYWFNRINATGLNRIRIKKIEKSIILLSILVPLVVLAIDFTWLTQWISGSDGFTTTLGLGKEIPIVSSVFAVYSIVILAVMVPGWLQGRPTFQLAKHSVERIESTRNDIGKLGHDRVYAKPWVRRMGSIPWNQLHIVETNVHKVSMPQLPSALNNLSIAHISDLHLTGYMHCDFYQEALSRLVEQPADLIVLSGDIIDFDDCLPQVQPLLEPLSAHFGKFYVLGNHDRRIRQVNRLRSMLAEIGWHDLGSQSAVVEKNHDEIFLVGNERPWFDLPGRRDDEAIRVEERKLAGLRIGVAHSPDQWRWGADLGLDLLFCGHTHGGQVRFPVIGRSLLQAGTGVDTLGLVCQVIHADARLARTFRYASFSIQLPPEVTICKLHKAELSSVPETQLIEDKAANEEPSSVSVGVIGITRECDFRPNSWRHRFTERCPELI